MTKAGRALKSALQNPQDWKFPSEYMAVHEPSNTTWWVANGAWFFDGYDNTPKCLGLFERHILFRGMQAIRNVQVAQALEAKGE